MSEFSKTDRAIQNKPTRCPVCSRMFKNPNAVYNHARSHEKRRKRKRDPLWSLIRMTR